MLVQSMAIGFFSKYQSTFKLLAFSPPSGLIELNCKKLNLPILEN
ncbi:hypothetical protein N9N67_07055 [Bacteriovoracaceae bacterium]|nr:hypothetical protein [Bacteriovoracaceae bacterium]